MGDAADSWRERALRDAAVAGDPAAWRALYDSAYDRLAGYVRWRTAGLTDLADDVIQETWLTAARRIRVFDPASGSFTAWVAGIAANVVRNQVRARRRRPESLTGDEPARVSSDPREQAERVAAALAALPERSERVLRAKYLDGQPVDAIARAWGETRKAVESLLSRARQAFREAYSKGEWP
jgi:RNA polymerase sigma-70 factor (ECF subfamily)